MEIGLICHWGVYSVPAYDSVESERRRSTQNGSEWYKKRLEVKPNAYRPIAGYKDTQSFHEEEYGGSTYYDFKKIFDKRTKHFDMNEWFKQLVENHPLIKYAILTARHHDGFCLWNTETTKFKSKIDWIQKFKECCEEYGIKFCIYYSWFEFNKPMTIEYTKTVVCSQINELRKYKPSYWWFDGHWEIKSKTTIELVEKMLSKLRKKSIVNSRTANYNPGEDVRIFGDRQMAPLIFDNKWEYIFTIGLSWGRNLDQHENDYKSGSEIKELYEEAKNKEGNFLINFGPDSYGELDEYEMKSYNDFMELIENEQE